jgi:hypothetical protein
MFVGHLSIALAARRPAGNVHLGWLMAAVILLDLIWPILILLGVEQVRIVPGATAFTPFIFDAYPWSHSLGMAVAWGLTYAALAGWRGIPWSATPLLVALVVSHWLLDFVTHAPDLPLWPGPSPRLGLGLWNSIVGTYMIEGAMWVGAIVLYLRARPLRPRSAQVAFWSLIAVSTVMWALGPWSPPPPSVEALGWFGLIGWLTIPWATLADRSRA